MARKSSLWPIVFAAVLLVTGYWLGGVSATGNRLHAEPRQRTTLPTFKSGGERSEQVLKDILATLQRMDQRLERLEKMAAAGAH